MTHEEVMHQTDASGGSHHASYPKKKKWICTYSSNVTQKRALLIVHFVSVAHVTVDHRSYSGPT